MKRVKQLTVLFLLCAFLLPLASCAKGSLTPPPGDAQTETATEEQKAPVKEEKTEEEESEAFFHEDPKEDDSLNVFFVSNSTCYYFTDELYGLLTAAGYENVKLGLAYISGCSIQKHCEGVLQGDSNYQYRLIDKDGLRTFENMSLLGAMSTENWDVITFDNNAKSFASGDTATAIDVAEPYFGRLLGILREKFPQAQFAWHQVWANELGYDKAFKMESVEQRTRVFEAKRGVMEHMMTTYGIDGVPTGNAWEKVRDLPLLTKPLPQFPEADHFTLCSRLVRGAFKDDFSHDGDIGGGQYLNACVWFEFLTGKSCVGNTFRPQYVYEGQDVSLTEEKIAVLQKAAHETMTEFRSN